MIIRSEQMKVFENVALRRFEDEMVEHCQAFSPQLCAVLGEAALREAIGGMMMRAESYGFTLRGTIRLYIEMSFMLGSGFDTDPQFPVLGEHLHAKDDQMIRADRIYEAAVLYNSHVTGEGGGNVHRALRKLYNIVRSPDEISPDLLGTKVIEEMHHIFPEKASFLGDDILTTLIHRAEAEAELWDFTAPKSKAMMAVLMFFFGHGCTVDKLYPWIQSTLSNSKIISADARANKLEKKAITWLGRVLEGNELGEVR